MHLNLYDYHLMIAKTGGMAPVPAKARDMRLDSFLALFFKESCPLAVHTDCSSHHPSPNISEGRSALTGRVLIA